MRPLATSVAVTALLSSARGLSLFDAQDVLLSDLKAHLNEALAAEKKGNSASALATTKVIKNIQQELTTSLLQTFDQGNPLTESAKKMRSYEQLRPQIVALEQRLGVAQTVESVLANAIETLNRLAQP